MTVIMITTIIIFQFTVVFLGITMLKINQIQSKINKHINNRLCGLENILIGRDYGFNEQNKNNTKN